MLIYIWVDYRFWIDNNNIIFIDIIDFMNTLNPNSKLPWHSVFIFVYNVTFYCLQTAELLLQLLSECGFFEGNSNNAMSRRYATESVVK